MGRHHIFTYRPKFLIHRVSHPVLVLALPPSCVSHTHTHTDFLSSVLPIV